MAAAVPTYKVILVGDPAVGKSNLIVRFANGTFDLWRPPTIGVEFVCRRIELSPRPNDSINVQIYDTAGQDTFSTLVPVFVRPAHCLIIVYDMTRRSTFLSVPGWMAQLKKWVSDDAVFCVLGNKSDLHHQIEVKEDEALDLCSRLGCRHFVASARSGEGVSDAFLNVVLAAHSIASAKQVVEDEAATSKRGGLGGTAVLFGSRGSGGSAAAHRQGSSAGSDRRGGPCGCR